MQKSFHNQVTHLKLVASQVHHLNHTEEDAELWARKELGFASSAQLTVLQSYFAMNSTIECALLIIRFGTITITQQRCTGIQALCFAGDKHMRWKRRYL